MTIHSHPLAWRWTDHQYALLPEIILKQMHPIGSVEASLWFTRSLSRHGEAGLDPTAFRMTSICTALASEQAVCRWLQDQQPDMSVSVIISWDQNTAIRTTWEVFTTFWSEFCYPSSDDVFVWCESNIWALFFHHEQEFQFGVSPGET